MKVIVCGSIGYGGLSKIREVQSMLREGGFNVIDHISERGMDYSKIKDFRDKPVLSRNIVNHDLDFVKQADVVIAISNGASYGTAIEIYVAKQLGKKVILWSKNEVPTPWPIAFSDSVVKSKKALVSSLKEYNHGNYSDYSGI